MPFFIFTGESSQELYKYMASVWPSDSPNQNVLCSTW